MATRDVSAKQDHPVSTEIPQISMCFAITRFVHSYRLMSVMFWFVESLRCIPIQFSIIVTCSVNTEIDNNFKTLYVASIFCLFFWPRLLFVWFWNVFQGYFRCLLCSFFVHNSIKCKCILKDFCCPAKVHGFQCNTLLNAVFAKMSRSTSKTLCYVLHVFEKQVLCHSKIWSFSGCDCFLILWYPIDWILLIVAFSETYCVIVNNGEWFNGDCSSIYYCGGSDKLYVGH